MTDMNDAPQKPKRKWIPIAIGAALLMFVLALGGVIFSVAWMRQHLLVTEMPEAKATQEFQTVVEKFRGQRPLLELRDGQPVFDTNRREAPASSIKLTTLVSNVVDRETQEKIDIVKSRLIRNFGYDEESATDVLNFVASIFARGDTKGKKS